MTIYNYILNYLYNLLEFIDDVISVISLQKGVFRPLNFNYTFFKALFIFCHCRALFSSVLFLKIIVSNVLYYCTVNLSRHNYFLGNKNLLFYRCLFCLCNEKNITRRLEHPRL